MLSHEDMTFFLCGLKKELEMRNTLWVGKMKAIELLTKDLVYIQVEKKVKKRFDIIADAL